MRSMSGNLNKRYQILSESPLLKRSPHSHIQRIYGKVLSEVSWSHGANTLDDLLWSLDNHFNFIEIDVRYHETFGAVLLHNRSDMDTSQWEHPDAWNQRRFDKWWEVLLSKLNYRLGLKLDFKEMVPDFRLLPFNAHITDIWINADVLPGPGGASPVFVGEHLSWLLRICKMYRSSILSLGWTTGSPLERPGELGYTSVMVEDMLGWLKAFGFLKRQVTFPLRFCDVYASPNVVKELLSASEQFSVTLWTGEEGFSKKELKAVINALGKDKVFVDLGHRKLRSVWKDVMI